MENSNNPNEEKINQQFNQQFGNSGQIPLPNSTAVLVLGIISIALCWCYGFIALTCGIIAVVLGNKGIAAYNANPSAYTVSSYSNLKGGRICAIIGLSLSALALLYFIVIFAIYGAILSSFPWQNLH